MPEALSVASPRIAEFVDVDGVAEVRRRLASIPLEQRTRAAAYSPDLARIWDVITENLSEGKLVRPAILLAVANAVGAREDQHEAVPLPAAAAGAIVLLADAADGDAARLAAQAWPLAALADSYRHFIAAFAPLEAWLAGGHALPGLQALVARVLLVHEYRRVVLRHPPLPAALVPADWPGEAARALCGRLYAALLPASEQWLDAHGARAEGALPAAGAALARRFREQARSGE